MFIPVQLFANKNLWVFVIPRDLYLGLLQIDSLFTNKKYLIFFKIDKIFEDLFDIVSF
jgi:hypothetical protein